MQTLKEARTYAYGLIMDGKCQYHMLSDAEKETLTGLIIQSTEKIHIWEYITEADYKDNIPHYLAKWLETGNRDLALDILDNLKNNAIRYASNEAMKIMDEQLQEVNFDKKFNYA